MRKFKITVSIGLVGCHRDHIIELDDEDVPDDWETNLQFNEEMLDELWNSGMIDWTFKESEQ